jgi:hypothetical protein
MMNAHPWRARLAFAARCCAFAIALCLAVAPIGMSCCSRFPCSAKQPRGNSDLPCHGSSGSHSDHSSSAAADYSACHAGEFALEAVRVEHDSRKVQEITGHASGVDAVSSPYASLLEVSGSFFAPSWTISPHLEDPPWLCLPLRL